MCHHPRKPWRRDSGRRPIHPRTIPRKLLRLEPLPGQLPARGVIEVKSTKDDAWITAAGEQVSRYWGKYRQVLVTNYRDFVLVGQDAEGKFAKLESFRLADSENAFWAAAAHPGSLA